MQTKLALELMLYGIGGVFLVLVLFIITIVLLVKIFPHTDLTKKTELPVNEVPKA